MKIGIIREGKTIPDSRVALPPEQCAYIKDKYSIELKVQSSPTRCFDDDSYQKLGFELYSDISDCDVLLGVKEVPIDQLIPNKVYFFFSHTIKKQSYNRKLLQAILEKKIHLIDYEVLTNEKKQRLIAFGKFAGMVGAHNALWTYAQRSGLFEMKRMKDCFDYAAAKALYKEIDFPKVKIVLTGTGRVANGAAQVLEDMGIQKVAAADYLQNEFEGPVFTQLDCHEYAQRKDGSAFDLSDFFNNPGKYHSVFEPYTKVSDIMINGIYWDNAAPVFFKKEAVQSSDFKIKVISDVTCDIAPVSSIPTTLFASTIADPVFGYDPATESATDPFQPNVLDMMTIDNLPNEMPRDASTNFGEQFIESVIEELLDMDNSAVIERATIARDGKLGPHFGYLEDYVL
mgnify:CR=1 FL=1